MNVQLHPLVLLNISDHISRQLPYSKGILLGTISGSQIQICDCFEISSLDFTFISNRIEEFKQVFSHFEWIGWYGVGSCIDQEILDIHSKMSNFFGLSCLFLLFDPSSPGNQCASVYEYNGLVMKSLPMHIVTYDAERVAMETITKSLTDSTQSALSSSLSSHLNTNRNAFKMLSFRIQILVSYLESVLNGSLAKNSEILCNIQSALISYSCLLKSAHFIKNQENTTLLTMYLATETRKLALMDDLLNKFHLVSTSSTTTTTTTKGVSRKSRNSSSFR